MDLPIDFFDVADGDNKQVNANNFEYEMSDFESDCDSSSCTWSEWMLKFYKLFYCL